MNEQVKGAVGERCWGSGRAAEDAERCSRKAVVLLREQPVLVGTDLVRFTFGFCARCAPFYRERGYEQVGAEQAAGEQMGMAA